MFRSTAQNHIRLMVIGEVGVGKSALVVKYLTGRFIGEYRSDVDCKYSYQTEIDGNPVHMEILDSLTMDDHDIRWAEGFMFVYDITKEDSVSQIENLKKKIESIRSSRSFCLIVVGNKNDLEHCREVERERVDNLASKLCAACHVHCSACGPEKDVRAAFEELCRQVAILRQKSAQKRERRRSSLSQMGRGLKMLVQTGKTKNHAVSVSGGESGTTSPVGNGRQSASTSVVGKKGGKFTTSSSYSSLMTAPVLNGLPEEANSFFLPYVDESERRTRKVAETTMDIRDDCNKRPNSTFNKNVTSTLVS